MNEELESMLREIGAAPTVYRPAPFWDGLVRKHLAELEEYGFDNFKRTVNTEYFNWRTIGILAHQRSVLYLWLTAPDLSVFRARFLNPSFAGPSIARFDPLTAWIYKIFVAMFASILRRSDPLGLLDRLDEPLVGNPFLIEHRGRRISQDLCNSVHELYSILGPDGGPLARGRPLSVAELGAGFGRLAHVFLASSPLVSYTIIDLPPALYISQRYLAQLFPEARIFRFRPFASFADVQDEYRSARIRFLLPHQAETLPDRSFDLFVNISSLHEMTREQVDTYFRLMDRVCRGRVYIKQWRVSQTPVNAVVFRERDYPIPASWRRIYRRDRHPIQRWFFDSLYEVAAG